MITLLKTLWKVIWTTAVTAIVALIAVTFVLFWLKVAWWTWKAPW